MSRDMFHGSIEETPKKRFKTYEYPHERIDQLEEQLEESKKRIAGLEGELSMMTGLLKRAIARLRSDK